MCSRKIFREPLKTTMKILLNIFNYKPNTCKVLSYYLNLEKLFFMSLLTIFAMRNFSFIELPTY